MTPLQDKLRSALRETAAEIPADAPPLRLDPQPRASRNRANARWRAWAAPLTAAALVVAVVVTSVIVTGSLERQPAPAGPSAAPYGVPAYYVALVTAKPQSNLVNMLDSSLMPGGAAELRSTQTGAVLAKITPPKPYVVFTGMTAAADDRTFILSAQGQEGRAEPPFPTERFFLLRIDPTARAGARMTLTALPARYVPAGYDIRDMALSADGTHLAAEMGTMVGYTQELVVFDLATGTERAWTVRTCAQCVPNGGGLLWFGVDTDTVSWTADGQHVSFIWDNTVRLLDIHAAGSNLLTDSKTVATWKGGVFEINQWRGAIITPDGRTVLGVEELAGNSLRGPIREQLVSWSTATGQQTAVLNNLNARKLEDFEQILYTSYDGSVLVLTYQQPGAKAAIVHDGRSTSIPWSPSIGAAAW